MDTHDRKRERWIKAAGIAMYAALAVAMLTAMAAMYYSLP